MSNYRRANRKVQWFADRYPGDRIKPNVDVLHTTEGTNWPTYGGGASAPTYTAKPNFRTQRLMWRAHFPDEMSARALRNESGGVETNTLNCRQVELVGTCDPRHRHSWGGQGTRFAGKHYIFWPEAPEWALNDLADFLADGHERHGIKLDAPALWLPYPKSYGNSAARMSGHQWRNFYGICGHQHVPENSHGDPGNLDIVKVLDRARAQLVDAPPDTPPTTQEDDMTPRDLLDEPLNIHDPKGNVHTRNVTVREALTAFVIAISEGNDEAKAFIERARKTPAKDKA